MLLKEYYSLQIWRFLFSSFSTTERDILTLKTFTYMEYRKQNKNISFPPPCPQSKINIFKLRTFNISDLELDENPTKVLGQKQIF